MGAVKMGATVAKAGMSLGAKIAVAAAAVVVLAGGAVFLPRLLNSSNDATSPITQSVAVDDGGNTPQTQEPADAQATQPNTVSEPGVVVGKDIHTLVCYGDRGFDGIAIAFGEEWSGGTDLSDFDIENLTVYINGVPNPVTSFRVTPWEDYPRGVAAYHIWFDEPFTQKPAEFTVSVTIKGVELTQNDFPMAIADENGDFTARSNKNGSSQAPDNTGASNADSTDYDGGEYDGERDAYGLRSGYGVWEYGRVTYEGYWANGRPNGHGKLTANWNANAMHIYEGEFIDGVPNGSITHTLISKGTHTFVYDMAMGYAICVEPWGLEQ